MKEAFGNCSSLKSVYFATNPNLLSIEKKAFIESGLESITLPGTLKTVAEETFSKCLNLETVNFRSGVEIVGERAFYLCKSLKNINFADTLFEIGREAFWACDFEELTLPASLKKIGSYAFNANNNLKSVTFGNGEGWTTHQGHNLNLGDISRNAYLLTMGLEECEWTRND